MDDKQLVNKKIYKRVALNNDITYAQVKSVMSHVGDIIRETIVEDDFNKSIKLDFIGNIYTNPERRKIITIKRENKEKLDGGLTINNR